MNKYVQCLIVLMGSSLYSHGIWDEKLNALPAAHEVYQDIFIQGEVVYKGVRDCDSRWEVIGEFLQNFQGRPFKMLDIGASEGYFTFKSAFFYPESEYQMIEAEDITFQRLEKYLEWNGNLPNIHLQHARFHANFPMKTLKHEHYDVVLCLNVIHHICARVGNNTQQVIAKLKAIASHILLETPGDLSHDILEVIRKEPGAILLGTYSRHTSSNGKGYLFYLPGDHK